MGRSHSGCGDEGLEARQPGVRDGVREGLALHLHSTLDVTSTKLLHSCAEGGDHAKQRLSVARRREKQRLDGVTGVEAERSVWGRHRSWPRVRQRGSLQNTAAFPLHQTQRLALDQEGVVARVGRTPV